MFETSKLSMDETGSFKKVGTAINLDANGIGALPSDYYHLVGDPYYYYTSGDGKYVNARRRVELVTSLEFGNRQMDYLTQSTVLYPLAYVGYGATSDDMSLYVNPVTATPLYIDYLRKVDVPFLDYYVDDTTFEITTMAAGATVAVPALHTARDGTAGAANVVSQTKNFEWHDHDIPQCINIFMGLIGVQLNDQGLVQLEQIDEPKIERE
jgi:hypothetical protein